MKTRLGFALMALLFSILVLQCQSSDPSESPTGEPTVLASPLNPDSLRQVYLKKITENPDPLPTQRTTEKDKVYPVDEAPLDTNFFLFRVSLLDAIARRDVLSLLEACDENIKSSFGGEDTLPEFVEMWRLDKDANGSELWTVLENVLRNGGTFDAGRRFFTAPYTFSLFPDEYDAFSHGVITGEGVRLRESPELDARIVTSLSHDIVEEIPAEEKKVQTIGGEEHPWIHVKTRSGQEGWVYGKYFASPIDFRAGFERQPNGGWQMVFLVAGD